MPRALNEADAKLCKDLTPTAKPQDFDTGSIEAIGTYRSKLIPLLEQAKDAPMAIGKTVESASDGGQSGKVSARPAAPKDKRPRCGASIEGKAQSYREASSSETAPDAELDDDWMKNRQQKLL